MGDSASIGNFTVAKRYGSACSRADLESLTSGVFELLSLRRGFFFCLYGWLAWILRFFIVSGRVDEKSNADERSN